MANEIASRTSWGQRALVAGLVAITTVMALRTSAGFAIAPISPVLASTLAPAHAGTQAARVRQMTQIARTRGALPAIVAEAKQTLTIAPLDHATARTVAMIDIVDGRTPRGNRIMTLVGSATLRDALAHAWLLNRAYAEARWADVAREANIVMRLDPGMRTTGYAMLNTLVADGRVLPQLARVLAERPPWRSGFLVNMGERSRAPANERGLFLLLRDTEAPPTAQELRTWFLVNQSRESGASLLADYRALAPDEFAPSERFIRNGNFEGTNAFAPFDWTIYFPDGGAAEITSAPEGSGRALYVEFSGRNRLAVAVQRLTLPPGRYRVTLRTYLLTPLAEGTVGLSLACGREAPPTNPTRFSVRGTADEWRQQSVDVDVPNGCSEPNISVDWQPDGYASPTQLYLDDVTITPLSRQFRSVAPTPRAPPTPQ